MGPAKMPGIAPNGKRKHCDSCEIEIMIVQTNEEVAVRAGSNESMQFKREANPPVQGNLRKKICMVTHSLYESDNRVRRYAEALVKRGDQVEVIAITLKNRPLGESVINGVTVHDIQRRLGDEGGKWAYATQLLRFLLSASRLLRQRH